MNFKIKNMKNRSLAGVVMAVLSAFLFASYTPLSDFVVPATENGKDIPIMKVLVILTVSIFLREGFSLIMLVAKIGIKRSIEITIKAFTTKVGMFVMIGGFNATVVICYLLGLSSEWSSSSLANLFVQLHPLWTAIIAKWLFKDVLNLKAWFGISLAAVATAVGITLTLTIGGALNKPGTLGIIGLVFSILGSFCYMSESIFMESAFRKDKSLTSVDVTYMKNFVSFIALGIITPFFLIANHGQEYLNDTFRHFVLDWKMLLIIIGWAVIMVFARVLFFGSIQIIGATNASCIVLIEGLMTPFIASLITLSWDIPWWFFLMAIPLLLGILIICIESAKANRKANEKSADHIHVSEPI